MVVFTDGFESGDFTAWSGTLQSGAAPTVENLHPHTGLRNEKATVVAGGGEYAYAYENVVAGANYYMRAYIQILALPTADTYAPYCIIFENAVLDQIGKAMIYNNAGSVVWAMRIAVGGVDNDYLSAVPVVAGQYYCVELNVQVAVAGSATLWIDGLLAKTQAGINTSTFGNIAIALAGVITPPTTLDGPTIYVDDVAIDTSYNGPLVTSLGNVIGVFLR